MNEKNGGWGLEEQVSGVRCQVPGGGKARHKSRDLGLGAGGIESLRDWAIEPLGDCGSGKNCEW
jgi:hypothetical protein